MCYGQGMTTPSQSQAQHKQNLAQAKFNLREAVERYVAARLSLGLAEKGLDDAIQAYGNASYLKSLSDGEE